MLTQADLLSVVTSPPRHCDFGSHFHVPRTTTRTGSNFTSLVTTSGITGCCMCCVLNKYVLFLFPVWCRVPTILCKQREVDKVWWFQPPRRSNPRPAKHSICNRIHWPKGRRPATNQQRWQFRESFDDCRATVEAAGTKERCVWYTL